MKLVCISDTHELHRELEVPPGDILLHAGDFTFFGRTRRAIVDFNDWLGELPHRHKVVVPGNHEYLLEGNPEFGRLITNAHLLINESVVVEGVRIWGSPLTRHDGGAFGRSHALDRIRIYETIPADTEILITHGPPHGILDTSGAANSAPAGDVELRRAVVRIRPRLHLFGHIHPGYGIRPTRHTLFVNAALLGADGSLAKRPIVLELGERDCGT